MLQETERALQLDGMLVLGASGERRIAQGRKSKSNTATPCVILAPKQTSQLSQEYIINYYNIYIYLIIFFFCNNNNNNNNSNNDNA